MNRLPAPMGLLIDRNRPLTFSFDGRSCQGFAGDTVASALAGDGRWLLSRSFKYHRPRGPLTRPERRRPLRRIRRPFVTTS